MSEITVYRVQHDSNYTTINLSCAKDDRLSLGAKGLHLILFSLASIEGWQISYTYLLKLSTDGRDALNARLKELKQTGYLKIEKERNSKKQFISKWSIYEMSHTGFSAQAIPDFPQKDIAESGKPTSANPTPENPTISIKDSINDQIKTLTTLQSSILPSKVGMTFSETESIVAFEAFFNIYPKKNITAIEALRAWRQVVHSEETAQTILANVIKRRNSEDWLKDDGKYIPSITNYLYNQKWTVEDEFEEVPMPYSHPDYDQWNPTPQFIRVRKQKQLKDLPPNQAKYLLDALKEKISK